MDKTKLNNYVVYQHKRLDNNEIFYVGIGNTKRPYDFSKRNNWWKKIKNKTDIEVDILFTDLSKEKACEIEVSLIKLYGRKQLKNGSLVNMTDGGDAPLKGHKLTEEHKEAIRKSNQTRIVTKETREKIGKANSGRKITEETRKKLSENGKKHKGKKLSEETKEKVRKANIGKKASDETKAKMSEIHKGQDAWNRKIVLDLSTGIFFDSIRQASIALGYHKITLRDWLTIYPHRNKSNLTLV